MTIRLFACLSYSMVREHCVKMAIACQVPSSGGVDLNYRELDSACRARDSGVLDTPCHVSYGMPFGRLLCLSRDIRRYVVLPACEWPFEKKTKVGAKPDLLRHALATRSPPDDMFGDAFMTHSRCF